MPVDSGTSVMPSTQLNVLLDYQADLAIEKRL